MEIFSNAVSLVFSGMALIISILTWRSGAVARRRDWRLEASRLEDLAKIRVLSLDEKLKVAVKGEYALLSLLGRNNSELNARFDNEVELKSGSIRELETAISSLSPHPSGLNDEELELRIRNTRKIILDVEEIENWIDEKARIQTQERKLHLNRPKRGR